jgi:hypothetical protein
MSPCGSSLDEPQVVPLQCQRSDPSPKVGGEAGQGSPRPDGGEQPCARPSATAGIDPAYVEHAFGRMPFVGVSSLDLGRSPQGWAASFVPAHPQASSAPAVRDEACQGGAGEGDGRGVMLSRRGATAIVGQ